jgi:hypothetical protein
MSSLEVLLRERYVPDVEDRFDGPSLDRSLWYPYYLPQWSSRELASARYELNDDGLHLRIERDQLPWCPPLDGSTRVSSLQTGVFSGPVGSRVGQHRFRDQAVVREEQPSLRLHTPTYGVVAIRAAVTDDPSCMCALWLIGFEDRPERSAEICLLEIFGRDVSPDGCLNGVGLHPFADPTIEDDFEKVPLAIDPRHFHEYACEWAPDHVTFFVDGEPIRRVEQAPHYPMQLMLNIYEFGEPGPADAYPKAFRVEWLRTYRPRTAR